MQNYIFGAGGHGKVVLDAMQTTHVDCAGFIDDKDISSWMSLPVSAASKVDFEKIFLHLAIGDSQIREAIARRLDNANFFSVSHSHASISKSAKVGLGSFIAANAIVASDAQVGIHCIVNHSAVVDHDCIVGDYTHIAPQVSLAGGVNIGRGVLVGAGSVVLPGVEIADYAVIGAGSVVTKNIAAAITVVGNPAKKIN
jgi:sugar O-acyltransferase (sialic acid O-acetyltransferase NeuD family)